MSENLEAALHQLSAQYYHFSPCIDVNGQQPVSVAELSGAVELGGAVEQAIKQAKALFRLDDDRHAAQLWFYSLLGSVTAPAVTAMVCSEEIINLGLDSGVLFNRDEGQGYWFGFRPEATVSSYHAAGKNLGLSITPIIAALCAATGMRPAPLWAVAADGVIQPAMAAGNDEYETNKAVQIARELHAGLQQATSVKLPPLRVEQIVDGAVLPINDEEEPEFLIAHRSSCCMIYHSPDAGVCTSCPHQPKEQRLALLIAYAEGF